MPTHTADGAWSYHNPVSVVRASLETLAQHVNARHVLLVTTPGFVRRGVAQKIIEFLSPTRVTIWDGVRPNPDVKDLDAATIMHRPIGTDCIIGLGGGSSLDAAKVLATTIPNPEVPPLETIFNDNLEVRWANRLTMLAIPTTSGTGSEVTPFATVWDQSLQKKYSLAGKFIYPDVALLDPKLTLTLGEEDTLYPALDTISHALESLWNSNRTPISRILAYEALGLSNKSLRATLLEPQNIALRSDLQIASLLAGLAISQTKTAVAHAISYPLTSLFGAPHGLACSFALPELIEVNCNQIAESEEELELLMKAKENLRALNLRERLNSYLPDEISLSELEKGINIDRLNNYLGADQLKVKEFFKLLF